MHRRFTSIALTALLLLGTAVQAAQAQPASNARWWTSLRDATLNLLLTASAQDGPEAERVPREAAVASEYLGARYATLRWVAQHELVTVTAQRLALLRAGGADDDQLLDARRRAEDATAQAASLERERQAHLERLASLVPGLSAPSLAALLEPALVDARVSRPQDVPQHLSGLVLRGRADIAAAEGALALSARLSPDDRLRLARWQQDVAADIDPVPPGAGAVAVSTTTDAVDGVLLRARRDVAEKLWQLAADVQAAERQQAAYAEADQRVQQAVEARQRQSARDADVLEAQADLLSAADGVAAAAGRATQSWIAWQVAIGGLAAPAPLSARR